MLKHLVRYGTTSLLLFAASGLSFGQTGADTYKSKCAMCHGADGLGKHAGWKVYKGRSL